MHVAQLNVLPVPQDREHADMLEQWHSLVDIAEIASSSGIRVSVIQAAWRRDRIERGGIDYHFIDVGGLDAATNRGRRFAGLLSDIQADVLHVHGLGFGEDAFAVSRCLPRLPILCQDHADRPPRRWRRPWWRRWYAAVSGVAFTTAEQARPYTEAGLLGPRPQVFAIPESSSRFTPGDRAHARVETGIHGNPCVLWVGHLDNNKDPLTVLDGVARAASRVPGLQLWCVFGSAPLRDEVLDRIQACPQLVGRVHLLGKLPHAQIQALMRAADLFVSGSRRESTGYALLEALACGMTPVVTDIPSFRALTGGGRIGRLWPCGDAERLAEALVDAALHRTPPDRVRAHFDAALSFAALGHQWENAYAQVRDEHARRSP